MNRDDVLNAIGMLEVVFNQYLRDVPKGQRLEERDAIQTRINDFLQSSFTLLPPSTPPNPTQTCPLCKGIGKI
jgi:hypothetical protein